MPRHFILTMCGFSIYGPQESHQRGRRYSWTSKGDRCLKTSPDNLFIRIEKTGESSEECFDPHSPIFKIGIITESDNDRITISLATSADESTFIAEGWGFLNPFENKEQSDFPEIIIPRSMWDENGYTVEYHTGLCGDYLLFEGEHQHICINMWAIGLLKGTTINLDGEISLLEKKVGVIPENAHHPFYYIHNGEPPFNWDAFVRMSHHLLVECAVRCIEHRDSSFPFQEMYDSIFDESKGDEEHERLDRACIAFREAFSKHFGIELLDH